MIRAFAIAMLSILILSTAALGQHQGTPQQQRACRQDVTRYACGRNRDLAPNLLLVCDRLDPPTTAYDPQRTFRLAAGKGGGLNYPA